MARRRIARAAVAVGITMFSLGGLFAAPAAAPRITRTLPAPPDHTADQCKNGGWAELNQRLSLGYRNQGACIAAVRSPVR